MKAQLSYFIKYICRILKNKDTYSILGNIATIVVAITAVYGYIYTIKPTFEIKMLEKQIDILNEKEQNITIENQKISKELLKKSNELNATNIRIAELNGKENELKNTNNKLVKQIEAYEKNIQDLKNKELVSMQNLIDAKKLYMNTTVEYISYKSKLSDLFSDRNISDIFKIKNINNIEQDLKKSLILPIDRIKQELNELYKYLDNAKSNSEKDNYQNIIKIYSSNMKKYQEILHIQEPDYKIWKDSFLKAIEIRQRFVNICKKDYEKEFIEMNIKDNNWNNDTLKYMLDSGRIAKLVEENNNCEKSINFNIGHYFF
ncbi:hypothetical protein [Campylobacter sp. RM16190]|uniref:hypothetical protein n=1 Tax=Campylobacter sp. RM16190 TaxID=1705727 RepID=UPI001473FE9B|nr:hypothetical protein [Campylobacter sp. RM16190]